MVGEGVVLERCDCVGVAVLKRCDCVGVAVLERCGCVGGGCVGEV